MQAFLSASLLITLVTGFLWLSAFHPEDRESVTITCPSSTPAWPTQQSLKVLSYNVQYMASKNYVFFYDIEANDEKRLKLLQEQGRALVERPSEEHVYWTLDQVAKVISEENPDIVMLQEINGGQDSRTHYIDQTAELLSRLNQVYPCYAEASYWKADYILHPNVMGAVDMKLLTLSKYHMTKAIRHQLPRTQQSAFSRPFYFQRANLETRIETDSESEIAAINTHFEAWGAGTGIMPKQVASSMQLLRELDRAKVPWVFGGDLNLLPPDQDRQRQQIIARDGGEFDQTPAIAAIYQKYRGIPSVKDLNQDDASQWYTHYPNDPLASGPDRTIDYLFYSDDWRLEEAKIMHGDAHAISDHLPVIGQWMLN